MTQAPPTSVDEIPAVCLETDLAWIFRLPLSHVKLWRRMPDLLPFPPLPWLDRQLRVSGCVVAWFLAQEARAYRTFREPLEKLAGANRRSRIPWWRFTAPHEPRFWARPVEGEVPRLSLKKWHRSFASAPIVFVRRCQATGVSDAASDDRRAYEMDARAGGAAAVGAAGPRGTLAAEQDLGVSPQTLTTGSAPPLGPPLYP